MRISFTVHYSQKKVFSKTLLKKNCIGNLCVPSQHERSISVITCKSTSAHPALFPQAKPLQSLHWLKPDGPSCKYPAGIREKAAATSVTCKLCPTVFQLRHFSIYRWQEQIKVPFLKHPVMSILASIDDPKIQGCAATFLAICELPHLIHDTYKTLARQSVISHD